MKIFICEKCPESFFTAVFDAYAEKQCTVTSDGEIQLALDSEIVRVGVNSEKCGRVINGIIKYGPEAVDDVLLALRSCDASKEQTAFEYIRTLMHKKTPVKKAFNLPEVVAFNDLLHKVTTEIHHLQGFLRFMESESGAFYAPYSPDNDITDLLMPHFAARFKAEKFVIHDVKRNVAGMYNGNDWIICEAGNAEIYLSEYERAFEALWKKYYKAVNIKDRPHEKQMRRSMPARYWKYLPEKYDNE